MGVISGIDMAIDGIGTANRFAVYHRAPSIGWGASNLSRGTARSKAVRDFTGVVWGFGYAPTKFVNDTFTFTGLAASGTSTTGVTGSAICTAIVVRASIEQGGPIEYELHFGGAGALSLGSGTAADVTTPSPGHGIDCYVGLGNGGWTSESDVRWIEMQITSGHNRNARPYASSTTPGVRKRTVGRIDASIAYGVYEDTPSEFSTPGVTNTGVRFYVVTGGATYWEILNCYSESVDDYGGDCGTTRRMSYCTGAAIRWVMDGSKAGAAVGSIKETANQKWPPP